MKRIMLIRMCSMVVLLLLFGQVDMLAQTKASPQIDNQPTLEDERAKRSTATTQLVAADSPQLAPNPVNAGNELFAGEKAKVENLRNSNPEGYKDYLAWRSSLVEAMAGNTKIIYKDSPEDGLKRLKSRLDQLVK